MRYFLSALGRNLAAGARVALLRPVDRAAFSTDAPAWLGVVLFSAVLDIVLDALRAPAGARFTSQGLAGELFALGLLMLTSGVLAALFRDAVLFLALPVVVLASFALLQVAHAAPAIAGIALQGTPATVVDVALLAWTLVVCVRCVHVVSERPLRRRFARAVGGGLLLGMPLWFAPLAGPSASWFTDRAAQAQSDETSPAAEPVMAAQSWLLEHALDDLEDEREGVTDLYFVGFAPDARRDGFRREVETAQAVMDERFDTSGRSLVLVNHRDTVAERPFATLTNLRSVLSEIGDAIEPDEDVVMLYLTGGPAPGHALAAVNPPLDLVALTPGALKQLLDAAGIRYRVIVVATCAAGAWLDTLQDDDTAVLVASPGESRRAGCDGGAEPSAFSQALFEHALRTSASLADGLAAVAAPDGTSGVSAQLWMGRGVAARLATLGHGPPMRTARAGSPPR